VTSGADARSIQAALKASRYSVVVRNAAVSVAPDGRRATVTCVVSRTVSPRGGGGEKAFDTDTVFTLEQRGGTWVIVDTKVR
jgi:hypothetical protein